MSSFHHTNIAVIGEAYGETEKRLSAQMNRNVCFAGASGQLMRSQASTAGISLDHCHMDNVYQGQPPGNDFHKMFYTRGNQPSEQLLSLREQLLLRLQNVSANVFVAVGNEALIALTGLDGIENYRGSILESKLGTKVIPIIHPAATLRAGGASNSDILRGESMGKHTFGDLNARAIFDWAKIARECASPVLNLPNPELLVYPSYQQTMDYLRSITNGCTAAIDIELFNNEIDCIGLSYSSQHAICIPFFNVPGTGYELPAYGESFWTLEQEIEIWKELSRIMSQPSVNKVFQNANFDLAVLCRHGLHIDKLFMDTMVAHHTCYPETPKALDFLVSVYTRFPYHKDKIKKERWRYNALDAVTTRDVTDALVKELDDLGMTRFYHELANAVILPYKEVGDTGLRVNPEIKARITDELRVHVAEKEREFYSLIGKEINLNSPLQLQQLLYTELGLPVQYARLKKGETEKRVTTDEDALNKLLAKATSQHIKDILLTILDYRASNKSLTTYANSRIDPDMRCRTTYSVSGTETGRLASQEVTVTDTGVNLQNQTKGELFKGCGYGIRSYFVPDADDHVFLEGDLSGADARIVAWVSGDPNMIRLFQEGKDIHIANVCIFFGGTYEEVYALYKSGDKEVDYHRNKIAKPAGHGLNYGLEAPSLARELGVDRTLAIRIRNAYLSYYPCIERWHRDVQAQLGANRTLTTPLGRKRTFFGRWGDDLFKEAYAYVPQSTVADIIHLGFLSLFREIKSRGLASSGIRVALNIHDAITCNTPSELAFTTTLPLMKETMHVPLSFPHGKEIVPVEFSLGKDWFDMKKIKE